jgi:iron complex transport system ATP-binding protein
MVLHDINQALMYSDEVVGLKDGKILVQGPPRQVISGGMIRELYNIELEVHQDHDRMFVLPV